MSLLGLVYFGIHQTLDFYANFPAILLAVAIPVAWLDATASEREVTPTRPWIRRVQGSLAGRPGIVGAAALAAAIAFLGWQEGPALTAQTAVDAANAGDWAAADAPARAAAQADPRIAAYSFTAGLTAARAGDHRAAIGFFEAVTRSDDLPEAWLNLAAERFEADGLAARDEVVADLTAALRIGIQRPAVAIAAGELAERVGERAMAVAALARATAAYPSFIADPWWAASTDRAALRDEVVARITSTNPEVGWAIALMLGENATARQLATDPALDPSTIDFVDAWAGDPAATERLRARCRTDPLASQVLDWCARVERRLGNDEQANVDQYIALVPAGRGGNGFELRVNDDEVVGRALDGNAASFWGTFTYRRFTPWDVLVPSLIHLTAR